MPATTYMVVDPRHDHSFRIPRPDLSVKLGVPDACTQCHTGRGAGWAARQVEAWYGHAPRGYQRYAEAFGAASTGAPAAADLLTGVARDADQPAIARATALQRLGDLSTADAVGAARDAARDDDPLVRRAAVGVLGRADPALRIELLAPLLDDTVRVVRMEAARALAGAPRDRLTDAQRAALGRGLAEYVAGEQFNADRPESHVNLARLYAAEGRMTDAEAALRSALTVTAGFVPASVNLADLYRATGRDAEGERVLRDALEREPRSAAARHALGLLLARQRRLAEALVELETAARLAPERARYGYVHAVALHETGHAKPAVAALARVLERHPYDRDTLAALVGYTREQNDFRQALVYARRLVEIEPANAEVHALVQRLEIETRR
jgi:tetratricopeptide (TPR) repeat protein